MENRQKQIVDLLVIGSACWCQGEWLSDIGLAIKDQKIIDLGPRDTILTKYGAEQIVGGDSTLILPGLIDAHTHPAQHLLRGYIVEELPMIWSRILMPYESTLTPDDVFLSTQLACLEMLRAGITTFADAGSIHPDAVCAAVEAMGVRALVTFSGADQGELIPETMRFPTARVVGEIERLYRSWHGKANGRITVAGSIRQLMVASPDLVREMSALTKDYHIPLHMHLAEHRAEIEHCLKHYHCRPVEYLANIGVLGDHIIAAHAVLLSDREIRLLADYGVNVVHCPIANLTSHGIPKVTQIKAAGCNIAIGTDGTAGYRADLFEVTRVLYLVSRAFHGLPVHDVTPLKAAELLQMITTNPAVACKMLFTGSIEIGKEADLILLSVDNVNLTPLVHLEKSAFLYLTPLAITHVIVQGKLLIKNGDLLVADEHELLRKGRDAQRAILRRAGLA